MAESYENISAGTCTISAARSPFKNLWQGVQVTSLITDLLLGLDEAQIAPDKSKNALMLIPVSHASCSQELQVLQCALQLATCTVQTLAASATCSAVSTTYHPCSMSKLQQEL